MQVNRKWIASGIIVLAILSIPAWLFYIRASENKHMEEMGSGLQIPNNSTNTNTAQSKSNPKPELDVPTTLETDNLSFRTYAGPFNLSGRFTISSEDLVSGTTCFYPDTATSKLIHRDKGDERLAWFCFYNNKEAIEMLGINKAGTIGSKDCPNIEGQANITIKNHKYFYGDGEFFDIATLSKVIALTKAAKCVTTLSLN